MHVHVRLRKLNAQKSSAALDKFTLIENNHMSDIANGKYIHDTLSLHSPFFSMLVTA